MFAVIYTVVFYFNKFNVVNFLFSTINTSCQAQFEAKCDRESIVMVRGRPSIMKKPETLTHIWAFSNKHIQLLWYVVAIIVSFSVLVAIADCFIREEQLNVLSLLLFLFFAITGFAFLILFLTGAFSNAKALENDSKTLLIDTLDDAIILSDASGNIISINASCAKLTGFDKAKTVFSLFSSLEDIEPAFYRLTTKALAGQTAREELRGNSLYQADANETQTWYSLSVKPVKLNGRAFLIWRLEDTDFARNMYEPLFRNLQEAINHLDRAPAGFLSTDVNGRFLYVNAPLANLLHIDLQNFKMSGISFDKVFETFGQTSNWKEIRNNIDRADGSYEFFVDWHGETQDYLKLIVCAIKETAEQKEDIIYRFVLLPLSRQADIAPTLDSLSDNFHYYFDNAPIALAMVDQRGELANMNRPFQLLFDIKTGKDEKIVLGDLFTLEGKRSLDDFFKKISENPQAKFSTEVGLAGDENRHFRLFFLGISRETHEQSGEVAILSVVETTAQKTLEDKMAQGQKLQAIGQLAGGIAHDFNNVLTAIIMSCDLLLASHRSSDPAHADLINIKNNANRAASLVQQLLAFSRRQTLRPEVVDLTELLSDVRNLLTPLLGSNIHLKFNHGRDLWSVKVDQASFQRVLMNLVINARDAMPKGGNITITTTNLAKQKAADLGFEGLIADDYVELDVEDNGTGIPKAVQEKMFEPFFTTKEVGKGTGLGLSMVYGIVKQTGGFIYCESEEGKGTKFRIFLPRFIADPVKNEQKAVEPVKSLSEKNADLSGNATVLLVEDEAAVRMGGVRALQSRGYKVLEAENGIEALDIIAEHNGAVDLVVSDVVMPEMDGPTLLGEMRKKYPDIKFVFVSGYAKDAFAKNLPPDAVFGFLSKPFTLKQLAMKVKEMLSDEGTTDS